jgi:hippurate hydrolase
MFSINSVGWPAEFGRVEEPEVHMSGPAPDLRSLLPETRRLLDDVIDLRRRLHRRPEIGLHLPHTQRAILEALADLDLDIVTGAGLSSVVARLRGPAAGRIVLLRADLDALPMQEMTALDFASEMSGAMHACGHDAHAAMLAGAARLLAAHRDGLPGQVIFAFQPGEEGHAGARLMIQEGLLDRFGAPDVAFAIHVSPTDPSGEISTRPGPLMASPGLFTIVITGRGGHPAEPSLALDPIPIACEVVLALQTHVARRIDVFTPAVITVTGFEAGGGAAIPETATLRGTTRTLSESHRAEVGHAIRRLAEGIASAHQARADVTLQDGYPPVINDPGVVQVVGDVVDAVLGPGRFRLLPTPVMPSEDFAYILQRVRGAMVFLGARPPGADTVADVHSPRMVLDEDAMAAGVALHAGVALRVLTGA